MSPGQGRSWVSWREGEVLVCWGSVCPCGYNLLTFDFVRLIVGYVATGEAEEVEEEKEEAEEEAEQETECNVRDGRGRQLRLARPLVTLMWRRCGKRVIYLLFILILSGILLYFFYFLFF